jgi:hypothetical protein
METETSRTKNQKRGKACRFQTAENTTVSQAGPGYGRVTINTAAALQRKDKRYEV